MLIEPPILEARSLSKAFGESRAVDRVDLQVERGSSLGIVGESGSGKTTLAFLLARLLPPTTGRIWIDGEDWLQLRGRALRRARRRIQVVFQDPLLSLNPVMTVKRIVEEPLRVAREDVRLRTDVVSGLLAAVGLDEELLGRFPQELSGGQRQRVAIARAVALEPAILIADEPVSALDPESRDAVLSLIERLHQNMGLTLILISHDLEVIRSSCQKCAVMLRGRFVEIAETGRLTGSPLHPYTRTLLEATRNRGSGTVPDGPIPDLRECEPGHWAAI